MACLWLDSCLHSEDLFGGSKIQFWVISFVCHILFENFPEHSLSSSLGSHTQRQPSKLPPAPERKKGEEARRASRAEQLLCRKKPTKLPEPIDRSAASALPLFEFRITAQQQHCSTKEADLELPPALPSIHACQRSHNVELLHRRKRDNNNNPTYHSKKAASYDHHHHDDDIQLLLRCCYYYHYATKTTRITTTVGNDARSRCPSRDAPDD